MVSNYISWIASQFWSEEFWLPRNETWTDFKGTRTRDLLYVLPVAFALCLLRTFLHKCVFTPLGAYHGLKPERVRRVPYIPRLEPFYAKNNRPTMTDIEALSKKLDITFLQVSNWFKSRRNSTKSPVIVKFVESGWKCAFYFCIFIYGCYCLYPEPFLYNTSEFFHNYPHHQMSQCIFWYYMTELSYYLTGLIWIFSDVKRKDFWVMLVHHLATVSLISFSFLTNYFRIGSVIMVIHDCADYWLEGAKILKYLGRYLPCMTCFATFIVLWVVTRLYFFPLRVIASIFTEAPRLIGFYPALGVFAAFLSLLQLLHIFWTVQIVRTAIKPLTTGELGPDARSDTEMSETESEQPNGAGCVKGKPPYINGTMNCHSSN